LVGIKADKVGREWFFITTVQRVRIIEGGKLITPAPPRWELGIAAGDTMLVDTKDGELQVRSLTQAIARAQTILRRHVPEGVLWANELIAVRIARH